MEKDFQTLAHKFVGGWIRFWFPWVRFFEQDSVGDDSWQLHDTKDVKAHRKPLKGD